ncbi:MAG: deoxyribonuclease IV [Acidobacteria bacterium]|nr:deoxyribonuclease IV [Acidobacteriota bacterium]
MPPRLGAHMSIAGGVDRAVDRAVRAGCETLQVFTASANQWAGKPLTGEVVARFREKRAAAGAIPVLSHDSYLINCASPDAALWERSVAALGEELERCARLGIELLVMHPGAHMGAGEEAALDRVARALDRALARPGTESVTILLENTAGQGSALGHRFEQLAAIVVRASCGARLGVCLDTQHAFAAGYDLASDDGWERAWDEFERVLGRGRLRALHLNDSKRPLGSRVDRHEQIGLGLLGAAAFVRVMNDPRLDGLPASLETEKTEDGCEDEQNLAVLRRLAGLGEAPGRATILAWRRAALRAAQAARARAAAGRGAR